MDILGYTWISMDILWYPTTDIHGKRVSRRCSDDLQNICLLDPSENHFWPELGRRLSSGPETTGNRYQVAVRIQWTTSRPSKSDSSVCLKSSQKSVLDFCWPVWNSIGFPADPQRPAEDGAERLHFNSSPEGVGRGDLDHPFHRATEPSHISRPRRSIGSLI